VGEEWEDEAVVRGGRGAAEDRRGDGGSGHCVGVGLGRRHGGGGNEGESRRRARGGPSGPWWARVWKLRVKGSCTNNKSLLDYNVKRRSPCIGPSQPRFRILPLPIAVAVLQLVRHTQTRPLWNPRTPRMRCLSCAASITAPAARSAARSISRRRVVVEGAASATHDGEEAPPRSACSLSAH
jgi:hypothetical protein